MEKALAYAISALISGIVAWFISNRKSNLEIQKIRYEMQAAVSDVITRERLAHYSDLYRQLELYTRAIQRKQLNLMVAKDTLSSIEEWYSTHGLLLGSESNSACYTLIRKLSRITDVQEEAFNERLADDEKRRQLIRDAWSFEIALKNDLGIFAVEHFDPDVKPKSYLEVDQLLETK